MTEQSPDTERLAAAFAQALRHLSANVLRVARGSGDLWRVQEDIFAAYTAMTDYKDATGLFPPDTIAQEALRLDPAPQNPMDMAEHRIISAALLVAAGRIARERSQSSLAENRLHQTLLNWQEAREEHRKASRHKPTANETEG